MGEMAGKVKGEQRGGQKVNKSNAMTFKIRCICKVNVGRTRGEGGLGGRGVMVGKKLLNLEGTGTFDGKYKQITDTDEKTTNCFRKK